MVKTSSIGQPTILISNAIRIRISGDFTITKPSPDNKRTRSENPAPNSPDQAANGRTRSDRIGSVHSGYLSAVETAPAASSRKLPTTKPAIANDTTEYHLSAVSSFNVPPDVSAHGCQVTGARRTTRPTQQCTQRPRDITNVHRSHRQLPGQSKDRMAVSGSRGYPNK